MSRLRSVALFTLALLPLLVAAVPVRAQSTSSTWQSVFGPTLQRTANSALAVMGYATVPDGTASDLSISQGQDRTGLLMGQLGTGFTVSESVPLYLEGYIGYSRYDPLFVATLGAESTRLPIRWNSVSTTIGVGWSFPVTDRIQLRPILNGSIGYLGSDLAVAGNVLQFLTGVDINLLDRGQLVAAGLGGAMVLAWYDYRPEWEFEAELRYSRMQLQSIPGTTDGLTYRAENGAIGLWTRYRWPTGREAYGRPIRYVLEGLHSQFLYDQRGALGFNALTKIGGGLELDMGRQEIGAMGLYLQRLRIMGRIVFGEDISGYSIGLGMSF